MALLPDESEYQSRVDDAYMKHVATKLRGELVDDGIPDDTPDEDVIRYYRDNYAADAPEEDFNQFLHDTYEPDFKAPPKTFPERAGDLVRGVATHGPSMARQVGEQVVAGVISNKAKQSIWKVGAPVLGGAYLARLLAQVHAGNELSEIADTIPAPDVPKLQKRYFDALAPGLTEKGYTTEQIAAEVQRRVGNVVRGYTSTQNSLMGDVEDISQEVMTSAAEGTANIALLGAGSGFFRNALVAGAKRAAGRAAGKRASEALTKTVAGRLITHGLTGAAIGGAAGAVQGGATQGAAAFQEGEPVAPAVAKGTIGGGLAGAAGGALLGGPLGAAIDAIGSKAVVDATIQTPASPQAPLLEQPMQMAGVEPEFQGALPANPHPNAPLGAVEGTAPMFPEEVAPRLGQATTVGNAPEIKPPGSVEPLELPKAPTAEPDVALQAARDAGEPRSISLPTEGVEKLTKGIKATGRVEGAQVSVRPNGDGTRMVIENLKGAEHGSGTSGKALDSIILSADEQQVPIDVTVSDYKGPRGGTIPAEKVAQWYERRGFVRTNETPGSISLHRAVPDKNPPLEKVDVAALAEHHIGVAESAERAAQLEAFMNRIDGLSEPRAIEAMGNVVEGKPMIQGAQGQPGVGMRLGQWLDKQASEADARINSKLGRLTSGFDPTLIGDYAIKAAAKMYRLGMTSMQAIKRELLKDNPRIPDPEMKEIINQAREIINTRLKGDKVSVTTLTRLLQAAEEGRVGADWYDKTAETVGKMFGQDADMMLRFLAATSAGKAADANVTLAMKAYAQWKLGLPFDGFIGNDKGLLEKAARGEVFGERKLQSILGALRGDENAVAIDRHVMRALGFAKAGAEKGSLTDREYDFFEAVIRDLARTRGMTPRQFQAALWTSAKIRQAQSAKTPREMAHLHTFQPYEGIMKYEHDLSEGAMTPLQWVEKNKVTLQQIANASEGVTKTRAGAGYTYDPYTYGALDAKRGLVTTLASVKIPTNKLSAAEVMGFAQKWKRLIEMYPGLNVGTFNLDQAGEPGMTSIDLNIVLPEEMRAVALALGKRRGQHSLWDLANEEVVETGFKGKTAGAPDDPKARGQWWGKQRAEIETIMDELGIPSRDSKQAEMFDPEMYRRSQLQAMVERPHEWQAIASRMMGVTETELKQLVDQGRINPISEAGLIDHVTVNKDGSVWEYVDPEPGSYALMKKVGTFRGDKVGNLLAYLEGKNIVSGHDIVQDFKRQAGYIRLSGKAKAPKVDLRTVSDALMIPGSEVANPNVFRHTRPSAVSLWITPDGRMLQVPFHLKSAANAIKKAKLKNPVTYEGNEHGDLQTLLNHGFVRVQLHDQSYAADSSVPLTGPQMTALKELKRGSQGPRMFAGRVTAPNGEPIKMYSDYETGGNRALNQYFAESSR